MTQKTSIGRRTAWLCSAIATLLVAAPLQAQPGRALYVDGFSADPGWITDQPANFRWDQANEWYVGVTSNAQQGAPPTRFAYQPVDFRGGSFRLDFDINPYQMGWSAGNAFGLFDENLQIFANGNPDVHYIHVHLGRVDQGLHFALFVRGLNGIEHVGHIGWNLFSENKWYRCMISYDQGTDTALMTLTERATGVLRGSASVSNIGGLPFDLDYLGFARDPVGDCCQSPQGCSGYSCSSQATAYIDNIALTEMCDAGSQGHLLVASGNMIRALDLDGTTVLWERNIGFSANRLVVVATPHGAVVIATREHPTESMTSALASDTGQILWTKSGFSFAAHWARDAYGQLYTNALSYPHGAPDLGGTTAPDILLVDANTASRTTLLVDTFSGETVCSNTQPGDVFGVQFLATPDETYDLVFAKGKMMRIDSLDCSSVVWERSGLSNRYGIGVPDINGDGQPEFFAEPSFWSSTVRMLDGATGADLWSCPYGSFDVLGGVAIQDANGTGVIAAAQLSSGGAIRRYPLTGCAPLWTCAAAYNDNTMIGLLKRADGLTVLSGWRHRSKAIAIDAATGQVFWSNVPASDADYIGIGVPDLTGDGNDDLLGFNQGEFRLYDGYTGNLIATFSAIPGAAAAFDPTPICPAIPEILLSTGSEPDAACVGTGETVNIELAVANLADAANGAQVLLSYDPAVMTLDVAASSQAPGWTRIFLMDNAGQVTGAFINNGGDVGPGAGPFPVATLVFHTVAEGSTNVTFRPDEPPFATKLTLADDAGALSGEDLLKTDSGVISIDDTQLTAANNGPVCAGADAMLFGGPDGMASYSWVGPDGFASSEQSPVVSPAVPGEYCLTATNADGCLFGPVCTTVETYSCLTVEISIPGLDDGDVTREVDFHLTACGASPETRTVSVAFTPLGGNGVGHAVLEDVDPATDWVAVVEGHTLSTLSAVNLAGGSAAVDVVLRSGDLQSAQIPQDGLVDVIDFALLASRFGTIVTDCSTGNPQDCASGADVTGDAWQNQADFDLMQQYFFATGDPADGCTRGSEDGISLQARPRTSVAVAELAPLLPAASKADLTGDGYVDQQDIRAFARRHGFALQPKFEDQLGRFERSAASVQASE